MTDDKKWTGVWFFICVDEPSNWIPNMQTQDEEAAKRYAQLIANDDYFGHEVSVWMSPLYDRIPSGLTSCSKVYSIRRTA